MDFILNNAIWLIIIAVVFVMALIGYIAEQNGFADKKPKKIKNIKTNNILEIKEDTIPELKKEEPIIELNIEPKKESLNIDKDFGKLLDESEDEDILVGDTENSDIETIDDDIWKF